MRRLLAEEWVAAEARLEVGEPEWLVQPQVRERALVVEAQRQQWAAETSAARAVQARAQVARAVQARAQVARAV